MKETLMIERVHAILERLEPVLSRPECLTCECLQALIAQIEYQGGSEAAGLVSCYASLAGNMHSCLGCEPCPPAEELSSILGVGKL